MSNTPQVFPQKPSTIREKRLAIIGRIEAKKAIGVKVIRAIQDEGISKPTYYLWLSTRKEWDREGAA